MPEAAAQSPLSFLSFAALTLLGAAGMFFGQPNTFAHLPPLVLLFPFCLFILAVSAPSSGSAFVRAFILGLAGNCAGLYWLVFPMHDVAGMPLPAAMPCVMLLSSYLALYAGLAAVGMRRIHTLLVKRHEIDQDGTQNSNPSRCLLVPAAILSGFICGLIYGGFETLSGILLTGFPWLSLSSAFAFWPAWVQAASLFGSYGLTALYASAACLAASSVLVGPLKQRLSTGALALILCTAIPLYGAQRLAGSEAADSDIPAKDKESVSVTLVQGNIDQNQKWVPLFQEQTLRYYMTLTEHALSGRNTDGPVLVVWPETAMPFVYQLHRDYASTLRGFAAGKQIYLLFGTLGVEAPLPGTSQQYNRVYLISPSGSEVGYYDKRHLVPFGEYIPFAARIPFLQNLLQGLDFSSGRQASPLRMQLPAEPRNPLEDAPSLPTVNGEPQVVTPSTEMPGESLSLGALICYEAIFPYLAQEQVAGGASILINVSNDAWFRRSSAPWQHLSLTAMRAVEQSRPIVRATNTGVTAVIDAKGRIRTLGGDLFTADSMNAAVTPESGLTIYHRLHPMPEAVLAVFALISLLPLRRKQQSE